jgi:hypothetical protein
MLGGDAAKGFTGLSLVMAIGGAVTLLFTLGLMRRKVGPLRAGKSRAVRR